MNPFNMVSFNGTIDLKPFTDSWVRNIQVDGGVVRRTGGFNGSFIDTIKSSSVPDTHIRSRNVAFTANSLRPVARFYPFFDSSSGIDLVPKLLEISMTNGIFTKGETVEAVDPSGNRVAIFRIAQPDHKLGDTNSPSETFNANPYLSLIHI